MKSAKALVAGAIAGATAITVPTVDHPWSYWSLLAGGIAALVAFQATYWTTNSPAPTPGAHAEGTTP